MGAWRRIARAGEYAGMRDGRGIVGVSDHPRRVPKPQQAAWAAWATVLRISSAPARSHEALARAWRRVAGADIEWRPDCPHRLAMHPRLGTASPARHMSPARISLSTTSETFSALSSATLFWGETYFLLLTNIHTHHIFTYDLRDIRRQYRMSAQRVVVVCAKSGPQVRPTQWWSDSLDERVERTVERLGAVRACGVLTC